MVNLLYLEILITKLVQSASKIYIIRIKSKISYRVYIAFWEQFIKGDKSILLYVSKNIEYYDAVIVK